MGKSLVTLRLIRILHTRDGINIANLILGSISCKDSDKVTNQIKQCTIQIAKDKTGHIFILDCLNSQHETMFLFKSILKELLYNLFELSKNRWGCKILLSIMYKINNRFSYLETKKYIQNNYLSQDKSNLKEHGFLCTSWATANIPLNLSYKNNLNAFELKPETTRLIRENFTKTFMEYFEDMLKIKNSSKVVFEVFKGFKVLFVSNIEACRSRALLQRDITERIYQGFPSLFNNYFSSRTLKLLIMRGSYQKVNGKIFSRELWLRAVKKTNFNGITNHANKLLTVLTTTNKSVHRETH